MNKLTFRLWCERKADADSSAGDFARDALQDATFPWDVETIADLESYLEGKGAMAAAVEAGVKAFKGWAWQTVEKPRIRRILR